ncbi:sulfatase [Microbulbifer agarilyticus]|uniref:sulfatase n=1 Tax=Microbulbifer agarilyticus TaxID=260552 RepID=UPI001C973F75|nr:sulfatase [Microbulbifer agarilyticus]MBY6210938.1 sulfatase [Microbulbifer agarilyticus]
MKPTRLIVAFLALMVAQLVATQVWAKENAKPNFVFIAIDDMNDWVGYMGGHSQTSTPNLDELASQGTAFMNAHSVAPGCSPSRNALLYGVEPYNSGLYPFYDHDIHKSLSQKYTSLPRFLKENGYETYGAGKIHHGPQYGEQEWSEYFVSDNVAKRFAEGKGFTDGNSKKSSFRPVTNPLEEMTDHQVASYGIEVIQREHEKPYFVAIGLVKPHLPFDCPVEFYDALPEKIESPEILASDLNDIGREANSMRRAGDDKKFSGNNKWEEVRRNYLACISWVDYNVGRIIDAVESGPEADNTVVILWSDHGYHMGEKKTFRKFTLWEEASRVPFIIDDRRFSQKGTGKPVEQAVTLINVYRTIAELAELDAPEYVDGVSLVPQLRDPNAPVSIPAISSWGRGNYTVRTEDWRYIRYFDGAEELYDHRQDSNEWHNLASSEDHQDTLKELAALLPEQEAPTVEEFLAYWSIYGADKKRLKAAAEAAKENGTAKDKEDKKKAKKAARKNARKQAAQNT